MHRVSGGTPVACPTWGLSSHGKSLTGRHGVRLSPSPKVDAVAVGSRHCALRGGQPGAVSDLWPSDQSVAGTPMEYHGAPMEPWGDPEVKWLVKLLSKRCRERGFSTVHCVIYLIYFWFASRLLASEIIRQWHNDLMDLHGLSKHDKIFQGPTSIKQTKELRLGVVAMASIRTLVSGNILQAPKVVVKSLPWARWGYAWRMLEC